MKHVLLIALIASGCAASSSAQSNDDATMNDELQIALTEVDATWHSVEDRWQLVVAVKYVNGGTKVFELDKATACEGGDISNDVFNVEVDGKSVDYLGMMRKRAHPGKGGFFRIRPGESMTIEVDLGEDYRLPADGGKARIQFDHYNHFSVNDVQLTSPPIEVTLTR